MAELRRRVAELEEDGRSDGSRPVDPVATFAEALERQTQIMAEVLGKKSKRSTIQVSPKVSWPMLDDDCSVITGRSKSFTTPLRRRSGLQTTEKE